MVARSTANNSFRFLINTSLLNVEGGGRVYVLYLADPASVRLEHETSHLNDSEEGQGGHEMDISKAVRNYSVAWKRHGLISSV